MFTEKAISSELGQGRSKRIISTSNITVIQKSCFEFKVPAEVLNGPFFQITFPQVALLALNQKRKVGWVKLRLRGIFTSRHVPLWLCLGQIAHLR